MNIIEAIESLNEVVSLPALEEHCVLEAQDILNLKFAPEFIEYSRHFGAISAESIELFGITNHKQLSVIERTVQQRKENEIFPKNMYVIEDLGIEGLVLAQDDKGKIFRISRFSMSQVADSLTEYILNLNSRQ